MRSVAEDTIVAIATAPGRGGVGIVRISGEKALEIAVELCGDPPAPRHASYRQFKHKIDLIDAGIVLYFPGPESFTGEDVVELQAHGGPIVLDILVEACVELGARQARPGEFSERAFLNERMDLTQAEAIADLINAGTTAAAKAATRSLSGEFSTRVNQLQEKLTELRVYVEAAIDFPEEEVDFLADTALKVRTDDLVNNLATTLSEAEQGALLNDGARVAILGRPNAGKSSLLNMLARQEVAIVTPIAGTTRDSIQQRINLHGVPVTLVDTAGLNDNPDDIEAIGIEHSKIQAEQADLILILFDSALPNSADISEILGKYANLTEIDTPILYVANKSDLRESNESYRMNGKPCISISAKTGDGYQALVDKIAHQLKIGLAEPSFSARSRHVQSLKAALHKLEIATQHFQASLSGELFAEDLRDVQLSLSNITGNHSADDLLGEIFSNFCIGK